jgi:mannose-6-phosphate isomerase-like protein (cupin superfamily)
MEIYQKKWGFEKWIENNDLYCGKLLHINPNKFSSAHFHKNKKETFYVIKGELMLHYSKSMDIDTWNLNLVDSVILKEGDSFTIEPLIVHRFFSNTNSSCEFIEFSTHHDDNDSFRLIESF